MDPDACLADILDLAAKTEELLGLRDEGYVVGGDIDEAAESMSEKLAALDTWLCNGGCLPKRWRR